MQYAVVTTGLLWLAACGGSADRSRTPSGAQLAAQEVGAPRASGDVATDGLAWIAYRRQQAGLPVPVRDAAIDRAAAAHSHYQQLNNRVTHQEYAAEAGFTGTTPTDRLRAAGYAVDTQARANDEVIAATATADGFAAADGLFAAIYHRYIMLQPQFDRFGAGSAQRAGGYHWLTVNFVATHKAPRLGNDHVIVWPVPQQAGVRTNFFTDQETPDPVPGIDEVGYPVSVHADSEASVRVGRFTIRERNGTPLPVRLLAADTDDATPESAAAIIPLAQLRSRAIYDVEFSGTVNGTEVTRRWSFSTW
jgi:uncharacterized protein YkwD